MHLQPDRLKKRKQIGGAAAGVLLVYWLVFHVFVSDETLIRRALVTAAEGFNETHKSQCLSVFAEDYREELTGLTQDMIGQRLVYLFLKEKHPDMGTFRYQIELVEDTLKIDIADASPKTAKISLLARFSRLTDGEFKPVWDVEVEGEMEKTSDGWKLKRSRHRGVSGAFPF